MNNISNFKPNAFSQTSHELRIPLTGILGMLHFLDQTSLTAQQKEYLRVILEAAQQLKTAEATICTIFKNQSM